jgi:hypothetical protein
MPKPVKKAAKKRTTRPKDVNQWARHMVEQSTGGGETTEAPPTITPEALSAYMAKLGRKGGKASGAKRMEMPVEERRRIASLAARAMWAKRKAAKKR